MKKVLPGLALGIGLMVSSTALAQSTNCLVEEAAQAALDREIELIRALATDPADSFRGPQSCINGDILSSFDLSMAIPDLAGLASSLSMDAINNAIQSAQNQVCRQINDAMSGAIGQAQSAVGNHSGGLSDELNSILSNGWGSLSL